MSCKHYFLSLGDLGTASQGLLEKVLKTTCTDRNSTAGTLQVKLLAEEKKFSKKGAVQIPTLMETKM